MKYCSKCGCELEDNVVNCPKCGNAVVSVQATASNQPAKTSAIGILAFVLSIIGFMTAFLYIGIFLDIAAIILAIITLIKSKNKPIKKGLPITGLVIAALSLLLMSFIYVNSFIATSSRVDNVKKLVNNIGDVTVDSGEAIKEAESSYEKLSEEDKSKISNYETLMTAKKEYANVYKEKMIDEFQPIDFIEIMDEAENNINVASKKYDNKVIVVRADVNTIYSNHVLAYYSALFGRFGLKGRTVPSFDIYFFDNDTLLELNKDESIMVIGQIQVSSGGYYDIQNAFLLSDEEYELIKSKNNKE